MTHTRAEALAAADALEAAIHLVDDDDAAEVLARTADQWRADAAEQPTALDDLLAALLAALRAERDRLLDPLVRWITRRLR